MTDPAELPLDGLTEKQRWFLDVLAEDFNPVRAARVVGMGQAEYDKFTNDPVVAPLLKRAQTSAAARIQAERNPTGTVVSDDTDSDPREFVKREIRAMLDDLKAERISPGQATAGRGLLEAYAKVTGIISQDINVNVRKSVGTMTTAELEDAVARGTKPKIIDVTPQSISQSVPQPEPGR